MDGTTSAAQRSIRYLRPQAVSSSADPICSGSLYQKQVRPNISPETSALSLTQSFAQRHCSLRNSTVFGNLKRTPIRQEFSQWVLSTAGKEMVLHLNKQRACQLFSTSTLRSSDSIPTRGHLSSRHLKQSNDFGNRESSSPRYLGDF